MMNDERSLQVVAAPSKPFAEIDPAELAVENSAHHGEAETILNAPVDICEDTFEYLITAEMPGVPVDDITVRTKNNILEIRANAGLSAAEKGRQYLRIERELGVCRRLFDLPADADIDKMRHDLLDGVLRVFIPKVTPIPVAEALSPAAYASEELAPPKAPPQQVRVGAPSPKKALQTA